MSCYFYRFSPSGRFHPSPLSFNCTRKLELPEESKCKPAITGIRNGVMFGSGQIPGQTELRFACNSGYFPVGPSLSIKCQTNSRWSDEPPICAKTVCPQLDLGKSISVKFSEASPSSDKEEEDGKNSYKASFSCSDPQREELEPAVVEIFCLGSNWSSEARPRCVIKRCPQPPSVKNAHFKSSLDSLEIGHKIQLVCNGGFEAAPGFTDVTLECVGPEGIWKRLPEDLTGGGGGVCRPKTCRIDQESLRSEANGRWSLIHVDGGASGNYSATIGSPGVLELLPNEILSLTCDYGFVLRKNLASVKCGKDGHLLNGEDLPRCLEQYCQPPASLANGRYSMEGLYFGAEVVYSCKSGYEFRVSDNSNIRVCSSLPI